LPFKCNLQRYIAAATPVAMTTTAATAATAAATTSAAGPGEMRLTNDAAAPATAAATETASDSNGSGRGGNHAAARNRLVEMKKQAKVRLYKLNPVVTHI
jgi:hypothetical protein